MQQSIQRKIDIQNKQKILQAQVMKIGWKPQYIAPKFRQKNDQQPQMPQQSQIDDSIAPQFHSPTIQEQHQRSIKQFKYKNQLTFQQTITLKQAQNTNTVNFNIIFINSFIWTAYLIGTIPINSNQINIFHVIDCIGNGLAIVYLFFKFCANKGLTSFDQILHIWSVFLTIAFLAYQGQTQQDYIFIKIIRISRTLRILFPFFVTKTFCHVFTKPLRIFNVSKKTIFTTIILLLIYGEFLYQIYSDSEGNRCRKNQFPLLTGQWQSIDQRLCGRRDCPINSFCKNPKQIEFKINQEQTQIQNQRILFDSSWNSIVAIFFTFTGNSWSQISFKYFDIFNPWFTTPVKVIGYYFFLKLMLSLITIFLNLKKQKYDKQIMRKVQKSKNNIFSQTQKNLITLHKTDMKKVVFKQFSSSNQIIDDKNNSNIQQSARKIKFNQAHIQIYQSKVKKLQQSSFKTFCFYIAIILFSIIQILLAVQFGLNPKNIDTDIYNRKIGIILGIFFIIQFFVLAYIGYQLLGFSEEQQVSPIEQNQKQQQQSNQKITVMSQKQMTLTLFYLQAFIFFTQLFDYLLRFAEGKYIFQQVSSLTSLNHFALCLRLYYIIMALSHGNIFLCLKYNFVAFIKAFSSSIKYFMMMILIPAFLGSISYHTISNNSNTFQFYGFFKSINNFFFLQLKQNLIFSVITGVIWCIIFQFLLTKYVVGNVIIESFKTYNLIKQNYQPQQEENSQEKLKNMKKTQVSHKSLRPYKSFQVQIPPNQLEQKLLKQEKSFFIFAFDNSLRQLASNIIKDQYYQQTIKFRYLCVYVLINIFVFVFADIKVYQIVSTILQSILIIDSLINSIALRFFGKFSFTNNKVLKIFYFCSSIVIILFVWLQFWLQMTILLQILRCLILLHSYNQQFKKSLDFINQHLGSIFIHFLIMIPILGGLILFILIKLSGSSQNTTFIQKLLLSSKLSLIFLIEKGNFNHLMQLLTKDNKMDSLSLFMQRALTLFFSMVYIFTLSGIFLTYLTINKQKEEKQAKQQYKNNLLLQDYKTKKRILKMKPYFDSNFYGSGSFFAGLSQLLIFKIIKSGSCFISILCYLILNTHITNQMRINLYSTQLFFFTLQISCFICECIGYRINQPGFYKDLLVYIISIPGSFIGFVNPVQFSTQPVQLKYFLIFWNALAILRLIKCFDYITFSKNIFKYISQRFSGTYNAFVLLFIASLGYSLYIYQMFKHNVSIIQCFNYAFIGVIGGDFAFSIQQLKIRYQIETTFSDHILFILIHLTSIFIQSFISANAIFQLSDKVKEIVPSSHIEFSCYNFNEYFHQYQFLQQWKKLDPLGRGCVSYRQILYKNHLFMSHFSITKNPYKKLATRIQTFKKLKLPIYQIQVKIQKQDQQKPQIKKQYVVLFYDYIYALAKYSFKEMNSNKLTYVNKYFIQNWALYEKPVSLIDIRNDQKLMNYQKRIQQKKKLQDQFLQNLQKQNYLQIRNNMKQRASQHQSISQIDVPIRLTKYNSQNIYFAHKFRNRIYRYLKNTQKKNQLKIQDKQK